MSCHWTAQWQDSRTGSCDKWAVTGSNECGRWAAADTGALPRLWGHRAYVQQRCTQRVPSYRRSENQPDTLRRTPLPAMGPALFSNRRSVCTAPGNFQGPQQRPVHTTCISRPPAASSRLFRRQSPPAAAAAASDAGGLHPGRGRAGDGRAAAVLEPVVVMAAGVPVRLGVRPGVPVGVLVAAVGGAGAALVRLGLPIPAAVHAARRHVLLWGARSAACFRAPRSKRR